MESQKEPSVHIAVGFVIGSDRRMLLVRRPGASAFILPGDKIEEGENPRAALIRWMREKLDIVVASSALTPLGRFAAPAANYPGNEVDAEVFKLAIIYPIIPTKEVAEALWVDPQVAENLELGDLTGDYLLPLYRQLLGR